MRENHREGYPLETDGGRGVITGWPMPEPKTYKLPDGGEVTVPNLTPSTQTLTAEPAHAWAGAPLEPTGATRCSTASAPAPRPTAPTSRT